MGARPKEQRNKAKAWIAENIKTILMLYSEGHSINAIRKMPPIRLGRDELEAAITSSGIALRGMAQNGKALQIKMAKVTSLERFGYENASSSPVIKMKRQQTFQARLGVSNPFQDQKIKDRIRETHIRKYGHPYPGAHSLKRTRISGPHQRLSDALAKHGISHHNEVVIYRPDVFSKFKAPRVDILIEGLIVEVFGDYFHANPIKYRASDLISSFKGKCEAASIWESDDNRLQKLQRCGFKTLVVWEYDVKTDLSSVIERIQNELENR